MVKDSVLEFACCDAQRARAVKQKQLIKSKDALDASMSSLITINKRGAVFQMASDPLDWYLSFAFSFLFISFCPFFQPLRS